MNNRQLTVLVLILIAISSSLFLYKFLLLGFPLTPDKTVPVWKLETKIDFHALNEPVKVSFFIPQLSQNYTVSSENFISGDFGFNIYEKESNRHTIWSIRKAKDKQTLYYQAILRKSKEKIIEDTDPPGKLVVPVFKEPKLSAVKSLLNTVRAKSADIDSLVAELFNRLNRPIPDENVKLLLGKKLKKPSLLKKFRIAVQILAYAGHSARIVHGMQVKAKRKVKLTVWLEVFHPDKNAWKTYTMKKKLKDISDKFIVWWKGDEKLIQLEGGDQLKYNISISRHNEQAVSDAIKRTDIEFPGLHSISLFNLPSQIQSVYKILLVIPIGVFLLVLIRNLVGIKTFGTFTPILISLAFRETQLIWGIILFSFLVTLGLGIRFYLDKLKLLLVPRLASVLILIILTMAFLSVLTHKLGMERGLSVALFPMVILVMTIERMSIVWEEKGGGEAFKQGLGSLFVASISYLLMFNKVVTHLVFVFPELLIFLLVGTILMGRYSGFRLLELGRFKELVGIKRD